jgi:hypothetical protein
MLKIFPGVKGIFKEMHLLKALLEVSLYFLKFIEYKKPSGFGGSETLFSEYDPS